VGVYAVDMLSTKYGYGRDFDTLSPDMITMFSKTQFVINYLWCLEITFLKISLACMYLRLTRTVYWKRAWKYLMYFSILYLSAGETVSIVQGFTECKPLRFYWDKSVPGGVCRSGSEIRQSHNRL
jgi:hypothetical protein